MAYSPQLQKNCACSYKSVCAYKVEYVVSMFEETSVNAASIAVVSSIRSNEADFTANVLLVH